MIGIRWLLAPFAFLWATIIKIRLKAYDTGLLKRIAFDIPTIVVGNLQAGGSGKTPAIEFLLSHFAQKYSIATLSRGYGRKTKGFRIASDQDTPDTLGDEPMQLYLKWKNQAIVAVGEQRILAIPSLLMEQPDIKAIFLDDAFQHMPLKATLYILLSTYSKPFFRDDVLPRGYLREPRKGAVRADMLIFTKCPRNTSTEIKQKYKKLASPYLKMNCPVLFATLLYDDFRPAKPHTSNYFLVSGIADSSEFLEEMHSRGNVLDHLSFGDHHRYTLSDVDKIARRAGTLAHSEDLTIVTTEKDYVKLRDPDFLEILGHYNLCYLPVKMHFENGDEEQLLISEVETRINKVVAGE